MDGNGSGLILTIFSLFIEDPIRNFQFYYLVDIFQSIIVVAGIILVMVTIKTSCIRSCKFSFLTPIFTIFFGWLTLSEVMTFDFIIAAFLVISGLILINR